MTNTSELKPSLRDLIVSIASTSAMNMGLAPNPVTGQTIKDLPMAKYNIELLRVLHTKTNNNLSKEEEELIKDAISNLQLQYIQASKS